MESNMLRWASRFTWFFRLVWLQPSCPHCPVGQGSLHCSGSTFSFFSPAFGDIVTLSLPEEKKTADQSLKMKLQSIIYSFFIFSSLKVALSSFVVLNWARDLLHQAGFRYVLPPSSSSQKILQHRNISNSVTGLVNILLGGGLEKVLHLWNVCCHF